MSDSQRLTGCVKWFNNRAGYGFITVCGQEDNDIFVHYSNVKVDGLQYTYLVQGEYVEFELAETASEVNKVQAVNLTGIRGGPLMCKTRSMNRLNGSNTDADESTVRAPRAPRATDVPAPQFEEEASGFVTIATKKRRSPAKKSSAKNA